MPNETTLAYYYNIPVQDVKITTDYNAIPSLINGKKISINNIHSFFWGPKGLTDTTNDLKERLLSKKEKIIIQRDIISSSTIQMVKNGSDFGQDIVLTLPDLGINSVTPNLLTFNMTPKFLKPNSFPYYQGSTPNLNMSTKDKISMIGLIKQRYNFMKFAKIKSTSEWLYRELSNIDDGNSETPWQGDRLWWYNHK